MLTQRSSGPAAAGAVVAARPTSVHPEDAHGAPVPHRPHGAALKLVANVEGLHLQRDYRVTHLVSKNLPVDLGLGCSTILPGQKIATVTAHHLAELSELGQWEVFYFKRPYGSFQIES